MLLTGQVSKTISTPGKPDKVSTVENDIGEVAILPQTREQSVHQHQAEGVCLKQDGIGEGKATESPMATKIGYDVQCEIRANESDAAGDLHMNPQNPVEEVNVLKENSSTGDQTATSSGESNKFYSITITCFKSVKAFPEAY